MEDPAEDAEASFYPPGSQREWNALYLDWMMASTDAEKKDILHRSGVTREELSEHVDLPEPHDD